MSKVAKEEGYINNVREDEIVAALGILEANASYLTNPIYQGNVEKWPNHQIPFIDYHINYLKRQPTLNPYHYISNLKLMLKKTPR